MPDEGIGNKTPFRSQYAARQSVLKVMAHGFHDQMKALCQADDAGANRS
jgi:hypothetical protein